MAFSWSPLAGIENGYAVCVYDYKHHSLIAIHTAAQSRQDPGLFKPSLFRYSFNTDSWIEYTITPDLNENFGYLRWKAVAMDVDQQKIFIAHRNGAIAIFTLHDDKYQAKLEIIDNLQEIQERYTIGIVINNKFHILHSYPTKHIRYDPDTQEIKILHELDAITWLIYFQEIVRVNNKIMIFNFEDEEGQAQDQALEYDIVSNKWSRLHFRISKRLFGFGCTTIFNGQFVVLFGGCSHWASDGREDSIYIYSVGDKQLKESKLKCPKKGYYQAFAINDKQQDEIITFGYIRSRWKQCGLDTFSFPPRHLIQVICCYYMNEFIHLFNNNHGEHCKIDVFELFDY